MLIVHANRFFLAIVIALLLVVVAGVVDAADAGQLFVSQDAAPLHASVLEWSQGLETYSLSYVVSEWWFYYSGAPVTMDEPSISEITLRWDGQNKYVQWQGSSQPGTVYKGSFYNGKCITLRSFNLDVEDVAPVHFTWDTPETYWEFSVPDRSLYPPMFAVGSQTFFRPSLAELLSEGESNVIKRDGRMVLRHVFQGKRVFEFDFDSQGRVNTVYHYTVYTRDMLFGYYDGDPFDLPNPQDMFEYSDYVLVSGFWFPLSVRHTLYAPGPDAQPLLSAIEAGQLESRTAWIEIRRQRLFTESIFTTIQYDRNSLIINKPLDEAAFHIDMPENVTIKRRVPAEAGGHYGVPVKKIPTLAIVAAVVGILLLVTVPGALVWRRKFIRR